MTEIQKLNETPLSQAIKAIILPRNRIETGLYFFLWIRDVLKFLGNDLKTDGTVGLTVIRN